MATESSGPGNGSRGLVSVIIDRRPAELFQIVRNILQHVVTRGVSRGSRRSQHHPVKDVETLLQ